MRATLAQIPYTRALGLTLDRVADGETVAEVSVDSAFRPLERT